MDTVIELFGYVASILIASSFLTKSMKRLRLLNMIGSIFFIVYSIAIRAWPVAFINMFVVVTNIYYLTQRVEEEQ